MPIKISYHKNQVIAWLAKRYPEVNWEDVLKDCPEIVWRHRWNDLAARFGLPYSKGHLRNLDSRGEGPGSE